MKMFLRLGVFVFLGIVFLFVVGPADGQSSSLEVLGDWEATYKVGDVVAATFLAAIDGDPASGVQLTITHSAGIGNIAISNSGITNALGIVIVTGTIQSGAYATITSEAYAAITADWRAMGLEARADFEVVHPFLFVFLEDAISYNNGLVDVGDAVTVTFSAGPGGQIPLNIGAKNINIISIEGASAHRAPILPSNYTTNSVGNLIVRGIFTEPGDASIEARWVQRVMGCCDVLFEVRVSATAEGT